MDAILKQMDPELYAEARRRQARVWTDLIEALRQVWRRSSLKGWAILPTVSTEEVEADLAYGRD
jgi:hypothetical protein